MNKVKEREMIREMYAEQDWKCHVCRSPVTQRAHILGDTKLNRKLYTDAVIDSKDNWRGVCDLDCNNFVENVLLFLLLTIIILSAPQNKI